MNGTDSNERNTSIWKTEMFNDGRLLFEEQYELSKMPNFNLGAEYQIHLFFFLWLLIWPLLLWYLQTIDIKHSFLHSLTVSIVVKFDRSIKNRYTDVWVGLV